MKKIENMRNKILAIIQLIAINILWIMFVFGATFFISWSTNLSTLDWAERMFIVFLILAGIIFTILDFKEKNR